MSNNDDFIDSIMTIGGLSFAAITVERIWSVKLRPWLETKWTEFTGHVMSPEQALIGSWDRTDLIGFATLFVPVLIVLILVVRRLTRSRRNRQDTRPTKGER